jgi:hypothetical protein
MARGFRCEFLDEFCDDPRCKIGHCVPEAEFNAPFKERKTAMLPQDRPHLKASEVTKEAKIVAKMILKERRIRPTKEMVAKVIALPRIRELAEQRVLEMKALISKISN